MESDTTIRRIKNSGAHANNESRSSHGGNGYRGEPKKKPEVNLFLLREALGASLVFVFILVLWALVQLSLQQLVVGKSTGEFNAVRAR